VTKSQKIFANETLYQLSYTPKVFGRLPLNVQNLICISTGGPPVFGQFIARGFRRPADFSIAQILSGSFGVYSSGKKQRLRIQFDPFAARLVAERKWHESQRVREKTDGSIILELELGGLEEIERWILSWDKHARVLAPRELATRIRDEAHAISKQYEN
jgi:predicted DNA-binding transcriptional regulator YafY